MPCPFCNHDQFLSHPLVGRFCKRCMRTVKESKNRASKKTRRLLKVAVRDHWICQICHYPVDPQERGKRMRATKDHIKPRCKGGRHRFSNLQLAHAGCNNIKGDTYDGRLAQR